MFRTFFAAPINLLRFGEVDDPGGREDEGACHVEVDLQPELALGRLHLLVGDETRDVAVGLVLAFPLLKDHHRGKS